MKFSEVTNVDYERLATGTRELDRVLGGGAVSGSTVLLSGEPGVGKTTLALQVALDLSNADIVESVGDEERPGEPLVVMYAGIDETPEQLKIRASKLGLDSWQLHICRETNIEAIRRALEERLPDVLIVDSIQSLADADENKVGTLYERMNACALALVGICKERSIVCFILSTTFTKMQSSYISHLVDVDLELQMEPNGFHTLHGKKNRFGDCCDGALRMTNAGFRSMDDEDGGQLPL